MKCLGITLLILSLLMFFGIASAMEKKVESEKTEKSAQNEKQLLATTAKISMATALATASKQVAGTVLAAELENEDGKTIYSFDILPAPSSEIIKEVQIDAVTGALIGTEDEPMGKEADEKGKEMKEAKKGEKDKEGEKWEKGEKSAEKESEMKESKKKGEKEPENEKNEKDEKD
ncbi:MAG: PepSY domain-containing protein [bacterium]